jgi:hypothetical protein
MKLDTTVHGAYSRVERGFRHFPSTRGLRRRAISNLRGSLGRATPF